MMEMEARHAEIVDSAMDPILSFGDDRRIKLFNAAAQRTFGMSAAEAVGSQIDDLIKGGVRFVAALQNTANGSDTPIHEGTAVRANGTEFEVEFTLSTLHLHDGREHTLILRDVSERRRTAALLQARSTSLADALEELKAVNEQLNDRTRELETAMGARSRFYASMSHELRTPINAILGYNSLLLDGILGEINDTQRDSARRTLVAANHLMELVNDVLDLSKVEAGKMEVRLEPVVFPDVINGLLATVAPFAQENGVELQLNPCEDQIMSDPRRIRQILLNLLSNAIKFGGSKPVSVNCWRENKVWLVIEVRDQGPGIPEGDQERIFEEFVQLEDKKPGTGLGLPISRSLAELLGGSLTLTSAPGKGSSFRLTLPADSNEAAAPAESQILARRTS